MNRITTTLLTLAIALVTLPAVASASSDYDPGSVGVTLEVVMQESGKVNVKGARVREVTADGFRAETLWGSGKLTWNVQTGEGTPIARKDGGKITLTQVTPGDYVSFTGTIQSNMAPFTVNADSVRDWSISSNHIVHSGTVQSIDPEARTLTIVTGDGKTITVRTDEKTIYAQSGARVFSDISEGDSVLAFGSGKGTSLTATKVNLTERVAVAGGVRPRIATGLGSWVDSFLPKFFVGRMN
ncbi:MAG TPA: hypothetical protein VEA92_00150 [Candidatus Paceibacterota bacterium]|nr:hypothetical protein [Candidatus Paceibacterota bacterium]